MRTNFVALLCGVVLCVSVLGFDHPRVHCTTTKGPLVIEVYRDWAPLGADRFLDLVKDDFFTDIAFFRCVKRFLTQFGISDVKSKKHWHNNEIPDDPNLNLGIKKNYVSYAGGGPNTRSTQLFIAFEDLDFLGKEPWETPFGQVIEGQSTLDALYKGYGDIPPFGKGPDQQKIHNQGNAYVRKNFPETDFILSCHLLDPAAEAAAAEKALREENERVAMQERLDAVLKAEDQDAGNGNEPEGGQQEQEGAGEERENDNDAVLDLTSEEAESVRAEPRRGGLRASGGTADGKDHQQNGEENGGHAVLDGNSASVHIVGHEEEIIFKAVLCLLVVFAGLFIYMRYYSTAVGGKRL